ncbi:hypothetical protein EG68_01572 [Paragonimus skrjabini miyazakii]|uniref:Uncharacterized protein n=1 Tax=Paragonimus skrjabini miyazakii TaxID=59628 RepID=A0A8S9ZBT5_9TREM|nr:hypothetical protein EG68_01572 [Paragonimus skrjabini miyazakii]
MAKSIEFDPRDPRRRYPGYHSPVAPPRTTVSLGVPVLPMSEEEHPVIYIRRLIADSQSSSDRYAGDFFTRLSYRIQYCCGEALDAIQGCTVLEPGSGYNEAINNLQHRFCQPHITAHFYAKSITEWRILKQDDTESLTDMTEKMKMRSTTPQQLHYESDGNSCRTFPGDRPRRCSLSGMRRHPPF